ncbi:MAG TPA: prepilin-type N-terminal cleavage/methylation domain-containing protein [Myxococcales bacterium]|nr:prepilin-type N-terminal cleavage/methylation domain-containing protein [Myxococcales bacterium]
MSRARGFSLIELMVAMAIMSIVVSGISFVLIQQSRASAKQSQERDLEENGRLALLELAGAVRLAGYGINPLAAFDFDRYSCTAPGTGNTCNGGANYRDRTDGPDELVVSWRDPVFYRQVTSISGGGPWTVNFAGATTTLINAGRIVQMLCTGAEPSAYLAVNGDVAIGSTSMTLRALTNADGYYIGYTGIGNTTNTTPTDACFATSGLMLVERVHYFVANDTDGVPTLWKERGRGANEKLFRGIEDLQFTYDIGQPPAGSAFVGTAAPACAATVWTFGGPCATSPNQPLETATAPDWRNDNYDSANRYTGHPVNIHNVNIFVVARSSLGSADNTLDTIPAYANRPGFTTATGGIFHRTLFTITEQPENLLTRAHFLPPVFANSNVGGG